MTASNHQPFEEWLLTDRPLSPYQTQALQEHLQTCTACSQLKESWNGVEHIFRAAPAVGPAPGFSNRFQQRLLAERMQRQRQQTWLLLAFMGSAVFGLLIFLGTQLYALTHNPTQMLLLRAVIVSYGISILEAIRGGMLTMTSMMGGLPVAGMIFFVGLASLLSVLWLVAYRKLTAGEAPASATERSME
jgi:hypothetical protein